MLKLHGRCGAHREAHDLVKNFERKYGIKPSVIHFTCLMSGCLRTKNYEQAWAAYELMRMKGVALDGTAVSTLLPGMIAAQHWDRVLTLATHALKASPPVVVPPEMLNNARSQMLAAGRLGQQVSKLQDLMRTAGVVVSGRSA